MALYSISTAADALGVNKSTISRHVGRLGIGQRLGATIVLSPSDLAKLRRSLKEAAPGNPNFVPGNRFGRKKTKKTS